MSTPFGDEDPKADVKTRVSNRQVDWPTLRQYHVSPQGAHSYALLSRDRLTMCA